jgi:hypothetical protein
MKKKKRCRNQTKFQYRNRRKSKSTPLAHKYMTVHFPDLAQAPQNKLRQG